MGMKFRLRGLAETFIEELVCPGCGQRGNDEEAFSSEMSRVTKEGIVVVAQCRSCREIFVPREQRVGIVNPSALTDAVERDSLESGEPVLDNVHSVALLVERLNASRKGELQ